MLFDSLRFALGVLSGPGLAAASLSTLLVHAAPVSAASPPASASGAATSRASPLGVGMRRLIALKHERRALRIGDFRLMESDRLPAFERHTDRALETLLVFANPTSAPVTERVLLANSYLMDDTTLVDLLAPAGIAPMTTTGSGFVTVTVPARSALVLAPKERDLGGYSRYKGVP